MNFLSTSSRFVSALLFTAGSLAGSGWAQSASPTAQPPRAWAVDAAQNELAVVNFKSGFVRYRIRTVNDRGDQTRDLIETPDGPVARLILRNGLPLTPEQDANEQARLHGLMDDPSAFRKHVREDENGKKTAAELIRLLPDAMLYTYATGQVQRAAATGPEVVLDFEPNPAWSPPTTISGALTGLQGRIWIDIRSRRMTHLETRVFRGINLAWGVLAHVNPGGTFVVDQEDLGQGRSIVTHFTAHVSMRALLVKAIRDDSEVSASQFQPVQAMGYAEAAQRLLSTPLPK